LRGGTLSMVRHGIYPLESGRLGGFTRSSGGAYVSE
jgi:hypothetical protein